MEEFKPAFLAGAIGWLLERAEGEIRFEEQEAQAAALAAATKGKKRAHEHGPILAEPSANVVAMPFRGRADDKIVDTKGRRAEQRVAALVKAAAKLSMLDKFKINGQSLGDLTPVEALAWAASRDRDMRFVRLVTSGLPPEKPIREYCRPDEADQFYAMACADTGVLPAEDDTGA